VNYGACSLVNCTLADNSALYNGGAIDNVEGSLALTQCTLAGNSAGGAGGGIDNYLGSVTAANCIIANNGQDIYDWDGISSLVILIGANIVEQYVALGPVIITGPLYTNDPMLGPLSNNGGPTRTMLPQPGSPAINNGVASIAAGINYDQRGPGFPRVVGAAVDIGALEVQVILASSPPRLTGEGTTNGVFGFGFTNFPGASFTIFAATNLAAPANVWSNLGPAVESPTGSGNYQFIDPYVTNFAQRFYHVRSP